MPGRRTLSSTLKCLSLLELIAQSPCPVSVSDLARKREVAKGTVHQQLMTLVEADWLERVQDGRYRLTLRTTRLAHRALEQANLGQRLNPYLEHLSNATSEAVSLAVLDGDTALIVQRVETGQILRLGLGVGSRMPIASSASGRVLAAYLSLEQRDVLRSSGVKLPSEDLLQQVREDGYALSINEFLEDIFAVAAPVFDASGAMLSALSAAGPPSRFDPHAAIEPLLATATKIDALLMESGLAVIGAQIATPVLNVDID